MKRKKCEAKKCEIIFFCESEAKQIPFRLCVKHNENENKRHRTGHYIGVKWGGGLTVEVRTSRGSFFLTKYEILPESRFHIYGQTVLHCGTEEFVSGRWGKETSKRVMARVSSGIPSLKNSAK